MQSALEWALDAASSCVLLVNEDGRIVQANASSESTFGYRRDALIGQSLDLLLADRSRADLHERCAALLGGRGRDEAIPLLGRRSDGSELPATVRLALVSSSDQRPLIASIIDAPNPGDAFQHFTVAFEAAPTGMLLIDELGLITLINTQAEQLFGYEHGELLGQPLELLVPGRVRCQHERWRGAFSRNAHTRAMGTGRELYGLHRSGREIPVEVGLNALTLSGKRVVLCSVVDITERKRAIDHFRLALEAAPTGMLLVDGIGNILRVNSQIERVFGYSREELVGQPLELLVPERLRGDHEVHRKGFLAHASTRPMGVGRDVYGLHERGREVPVEIVLTPLDERDGRVVLASIVDITERKLGERALRENEARYRELFSNSPVALLEEDFSEARKYLLGVKGADTGDLEAWLDTHADVLRGALCKVKAVMANRQALELLEADCPESLQSLSSFFVQETMSWFRAATYALLRGERYFGQETVTRTLKNGRRVVSKRVHILPGHENTWSRVVVSLFDLTPHKDAELQLRTSLHEKEMLLREIHHRVKNNLQIISSLLNMKADALDSTVSRQVFVDCQARIQSLAFVHEHLYVSADVSRVPFGDYARTLVEHLKRCCRRPGLSVQTLIEIEDIELSIDDAIPCGLIVNELVTNALKHAFSLPGRGSIEILMYRCEDELVELVVRDDGRGLPHGLEPRNSGTLGLELVHTFVDQLRASVQVTGGPGTCVTIRFRPGSTARAAH